MSRLILVFIVVAFAALGAAQIAEGNARLGVASLLLGGVNWLLLGA